MHAQGVKGFICMSISGDDDPEVSERVLSSTKPSTTTDLPIALKHASQHAGYVPYRALVIYRVRL